MLAPVFRNLLQLRHVNFSTNPLGYNGMDEFCKAWKKLRHVSWLSLENAAVGCGSRCDPHRQKAATVNFMDSIRLFKDLEHLDLTNFPAPQGCIDTCAHALADALGCNSNLRFLAVECGRWRRPTMHALMHALSSHTRLLSLELCDSHRRYPRPQNGSCTEAVSAFAAGVLRFPSMAKLTCLSIRCSAEGAATSALASALVVLTSLLSLDLHGLRVLDEVSSSALADGLRGLTQMTRLSITRAGTKAPVAAPLAAALRNLNQLAFIALSVDFREPEGDDAVLEESRGLPPFTLSLIHI